MLFPPPLVKLMQASQPLNRPFGSVQRLELGFSTASSEASSEASADAAAYII